MTSMTAANDGRWCWDCSFSPLSAPTCTSRIGKSSQDADFQRVLERCQLEALEYVGGKRVGQKLPRHRHSNSPAAQIKQRRLVEPSHCRPMSALHIVGEDLELRLRVDARMTREKEIVVALL